jgi:hypothetical protein
MDMELRLRRLEKENRGLKIGGFVSVVFILIAIAASHMKTVEAAPMKLDVDTVTAQRFVLVDASGKSVGQFGISDDGLSHLRMYDRNGNLGVTLRPVSGEAGGGGLLAMGNTTTPEFRSRLLIRAYDDNRRPFINAFNEFDQLLWGMP